MIKQVGTLSIVAGVTLLAWLGFGHIEVDQKQKQFLETFQTIKAEGAPSPNHDSAPLEGSSENVIGVLEIPVIDLEYPVLSGADADTLDLSLGAIEGLDPPSKTGGSHAIAGHQAHVFGKYFNRLHELQKGDRISYSTVEGTYSYEVFRIQIVKPHEVEVLERQEGLTILSLITCYPERSNKYRLVVQAKRAD